MTNDPYPTLHSLGLGPELESIERILAKGRAGKHASDDLLSHGADFHFAKADSHLVRSGSHYTALDDETAEPHLMHAVTRLLMTQACARTEAEG